jgi:hypothetical protein
VKRKSDSLPQLSVTEALRHLLLVNSLKKNN